MPSGKPSGGPCTPAHHIHIVAAGLSSVRHGMGGAPRGDRDRNGSREAAPPHHKVTRRRVRRRRGTGPPSPITSMGEHWAGERIPPPGGADEGAARGRLARMR
eukprot:gene35275-60293_t